MSAPVRQEVPIRSFTIAAYVCKIENNKCYYLLLKSSKQYLNSTWQMVSGKIDKDETAWQAALRKIKEETSLKPDTMYSADKLEKYYEYNLNCINLVPVFVGFVNEKANIKLNSDKHTEYKWVLKNEAKDYLESDSQLDSIEHIEEKFIKRKPGKLLKIKL